MLVRKDKLVQEMSQLLAEFYKNIRMTCMKLSNSHSKERTLLLNMQCKEKKPCFPGEKKKQIKQRRGNHPFLVKGNKKLNPRNKKPEKESKKNCFWMTLQVRKISDNKIPEQEMKPSYIALELPYLTL